MKQSNPLPGGEIALFQTPDGQILLDVHLERETVWLTQAQMVELFGRDQSVISRHVRNVFAEGELPTEGNMQKMHIPFSDKPVIYYSLDVIISVGYRVKSLRGTQFRIWATRTLRDHLVQGYTLNERRLREKGLTEMEEAVRLLARTLSAHELVNYQGRAVLDVVTRYARSWRLLLQYDENRLPESPVHPTRPVAGLSSDESRRAISALKQALMAKGEATALFGQERGSALDGILGSIEQTFGGEALYPSVETRAAHLLYFIIKDHPFSDGNKRIGSFLFLLYLDRNGLSIKPDGTPRFANNALVAVALLVAESDPAHKELLIRLILNLLQDGGE
ncbi:RhuM family protein [Thermithiobacillus tepidarius DSM 3134]|uniref:RhuM family protein n=1 Tax=Thermithiobacillus tepidarius TaxID=929 RepID=UPI00041DFE87|nr:RhuM family protein [Thermithiobacillus tepidarius]